MMSSKPTKLGYNFAFLSGDLSAGLTIGVMLIPQGMAYALLAGLPPIYGLYGSTVPLLVYALLGSFPKLAVGPTAISSILVASGLMALAEPGSQNYIELAMLLAAMVGILQLLMGVFRAGNLLKFIHPAALSGFTTGVAVLVAVGQLDFLLGVQSSGAHFAQRTWHLISVVPNTHGP
ncbi:MAG: SulP family inorganic anion transporter, partial [Bacteroidota bacterium]